LIRAVIEELSKKQIIRSCSLEEEKRSKILDSLSDPKKNVINIAGKIKFKQELELISNLDVMLSMDSGNGHIAAMLGVK
jgi:ADP-heptose:LPS heptosyltransferase